MTDDHEPDEPSYSPSSRDAGDFTTPAFPRAGNEASVKVTRELKLRAWVGRKDNLDRIVKEAEDALASKYDAVIASLDLELDSWDRKSRVEDALRGLQLEVRIEGSGGRMVRTGSLDAVLAETDFSEVEAITMKNSGWSLYTSYPKFDLRIARETDPWRRPVLLEVSGPDKQWVGGLYDVLASQLRSKVPWWSVFRASWVPSSIGALVGLAVFWWLFASSSDEAQHDGGLVATYVVMCVAVGSVLGTMLIGDVLRRIFPSFELLEPGAEPRGRQCWPSSLAF